MAAAAHLITVLSPLLLAAVTLGSAWWYVTIYSQKSDTPLVAGRTLEGAPSAALQEPPAPKGLKEPPGASLQEPPGAEPARKNAEEGLQALGEPVEAPRTAAVPEAFYTGFWLSCAITLALLALYYWQMDVEQFEILRMLVSSVMPLAMLTFIVLGANGPRSS